jgi:hypothetical protein
MSDDELVILSAFCGAIAQSNWTILASLQKEMDKEELDSSIYIDIGQIFYELELDIIEEIDIIKHISIEETLVYYKGYYDSENNNWRVGLSNRGFRWTKIEEI